MGTPTTSAAAWILLLVAAAFEIGFAISLKYTHGFTRPGPSLLTLVLAVSSLVVLTRTLAVLPVGTAYAAWTGIGAVGAVALGIVLFGEPVSVGRLVSVGLVILGVIGLRVLAPESQAPSPGGGTPDAAAQPFVASAGQ